MDVEQPRYFARVVPVLSAPRAGERLRERDVEALAVRQ
jgi:hypothetical protein